MNDSAPKRRRRRRGGGAKKPAGEQPAAQPSARPKAKGKESGRRRSTAKKTGRSPRKPVAVRAERLSPEEALDRMIRDFPPEYSKLTEFVQLCRKFRDRSEEHSEAEFFYFIATSIETLAEEKFDELFYSKYNDDLKKMRLEAGLEEDQYWKAGDPEIPDVYRDLLEDFRTEKRALLAKMFRNFGEAEIADLLEEDYPEYVARCNSGKSEFYSRHTFEAVRMEPSEMNPQEWEKAETETGPVEGDVVEDDYDYDLGEEE